MGCHDIAGHGTRSAADDDEAERQGRRNTLPYRQAGGAKAEQRHDRILGGHTERDLSGSGKRRARLSRLEHDAQRQHGGGKAPEEIVHEDQEGRRVGKGCHGSGKRQQRQVTRKQLPDHSPSLKQIAQLVVDGDGRLRFVQGVKMQARYAALE